MSADGYLSTQQAAASRTYIAQKHTESGYALIQASSLVYENFIAKPGPRVPSLYPTPEAQITDAIVIDPQVDGSGDNGYVEIQPDFLGGVYTYAPPNAAVTINSASGQARFRLPARGAANCLEAFWDSDDIHVISDGTTGWMPITIPAVMGHNLTFRYSITDKGDWGAYTKVNISFRSNGGPPATYTTQVTTANAGSALCVINTGADEFAISIEADSACYGQMAFTIYDASGFTYGTDYRSMQFTPFPYLSAVSQLYSTRRIGGDVLATYTGSEFYSGGRIACALVPYEWTPSVVDGPYQSIARLRSNRDDQPLRYGGHVTWRPLDLEDLLPMKAEDTHTPSSKMVVGWQQDSAEASIRVRACTLVGIYSTNPIYGPMDITPPITDSMLEAVYEYYASFPVATSNKDHVFVKSLKSAANKTATIIRGLLEHDKAIAAALAAGGHPEAAAAVMAFGAASRSLKKGSSQSTKALSKPKVQKKAQAGRRPQPPAKPLRPRRA